MTLDFGLTPQQRMIVGHARTRRLAGAQRPQIRPPLWLIALITLLLQLLLVMLPGGFLSLFLVPSLGFWQRHRIEARISAWADEVNR